MIKKLITKGLHHHFKQCRGPFHSWPSPKGKPRILSKHAGYTFLLKSWFCMLNAIQNGIKSSGDVITYFLGNCLKPGCSERCSCLYKLTETGFKRTHTFLQGIAQGVRTSFGWDFTPSFFFPYEEIVTSSGVIPENSLNLTW